MIAQAYSRSSTWDLSAQWNFRFMTEHCGHPAANNVQTVLSVE